MLYKDCEYCEGTGIAITSNCCDAEFTHDRMRCSECDEHIGDNECRDCNGQGKYLNHLDTKQDY